MGYIKHDAIICTSQLYDHAERAHKKAKELLPDLTSELIKHPVNGGASFFISPDGSKEGWGESDLYDQARLKFLDWIKSRRTLYVDFFYLAFGGDDKHQFTLKDSNR